MDKDPAKAADARVVVSFYRTLHLLASIKEGAQAATYHKHQAHELVQLCGRAQPYLERLQRPSAAPNVCALALLQKCFEKADGVMRECGRSDLYCALNFDGVTARIDAAYTSVADVLHRVGLGNQIEERPPNALGLGLFNAQIYEDLGSQKRMVEAGLAAGRIKLKDLAKCRSELEELQSEMEQSGQQTDRNEINRKELIAYLAAMCPSEDPPSPKAAPPGFLCKTCVHSSKRHLRTIQKFLEQSPLQIPSIRPPLEKTEPHDSMLSSLTITDPTEVGSPSIAAVTPLTDPPPPEAETRSAVPAHHPEKRDAANPAAPAQQAAMPGRKSAKKGKPAGARKQREHGASGSDDAATNRGRAELIFACPVPFEDGRPKDPKKAVAWLRSIAAKGSPVAQIQLGDLLMRGEDVAKDSEEAVRWYRKAASLRSAMAQCRLGDCFCFGDGVVKDYTEARAWYSKSAKQGNSEGQYKYGNCFRLGLGMAVDPKLAAAWFRKSAEQGDRVGQCKYGLCFEHGEGVKKDLKQAVSWYQKAAQQGDAEAQTRLAACLVNGQGTAKDMSEAATWFFKAAERGVEEAGEVLALLADKGVGEARSMLAALKATKGVR